MKITTTFILIMLLAFSTLFITDIKAVSLESAETAESCLAGDDLDGDFLTGVSDPDCAAFTSAPQNSPAVETAQSCELGTDADGDFLTGVSDPDCTTFLPVPQNSQTPAAETVQSCELGTDADGDFLTGVSDPDCAAFTSAPQNSPAVETAQSCLAGDDLDGDFLTGVSDPDCAAFNKETATTTQETATTTATTTTTQTTTGGGSGTSGPSFGGGSSGGGSFGGGITSGTPVSAIATGTPVSATSSEPICEQMLLTYMRKGKVNNVAEVKKLQGLLNRYLNLNIPITGFFGNMTHNAVKAFQLKYKDSVLTPWGLTAPTGYFYKTTQRQMNLLLCSTADIPMPILN